MDFKGPVMREFIVTSIDQAEGDREHSDFIQGRAAATVGSAHYLNKVQNATEEYEKLIRKFPI
jgi:intergrase/recombinase